MEQQYKKSKQPIVSTKNSQMPNDKNHDNESEEEECWNELNEMETQDECNHQGASIDKYYTICDQKKVAQNFSFEDEGIHQDAIYIFLEDTNYFIHPSHS